MNDQISGGLTPEERAKLQRDIALNHAADNAMDRDAAEAKAEREASVNSVLLDEARTATRWAAHTAAAKSLADRRADAAQSEARASTTGFFVLLSVLVVVGIIALIVYANQSTVIAENPPVERIINNVPLPQPAQNPSPTTVVTPSTPSPAPNITINTPSSTAPAPPTNTIILQPPAIARPSGSNTGGSQSPSGAANQNGATESTGTASSPTSDTGNSGQ